MRTRGVLSSASAAAFCVLLCSCPSSDSGGGALPDAIECNHDSDCHGSDDGLWCNGGPRCVEQTFMTDHGPWHIKSCRLMPAPCGPTETCDEVRHECFCSFDDLDGDGHNSPACGGDDCDDRDGDRYPGNAEVCDNEGHDEDCDDLTYGIRDADADGAPDQTCCNGDNCGTDCDDSQPGVHPDSVEACDGRDNDCDGFADEGVLVMAYPDADGDGWGKGRGRQICAGLAGYAIANGDCDDSHSELHPGAFRCASGSSGSAIEMCSDDGTWMDDSCAGEGLCVPQPDGSGVCLPGDDMPPQCSDGIDNDHDGQIDWSDPQCTSPLDNTEAERACADGMDNDDDGHPDYPDDPGCTSLEDNNEADPSTPPTCSNGLDDDGDGTVDYAGGAGDPGCISAADDDERQADGPTCDNGIDDDGDTKTDYPDDDSCKGMGPSGNGEIVPACSNGLDDDFDGLIDSADPGCSSPTDTSERQLNGNYACDNDTDDDMDGVADYPGDPGCTGPTDAME